jgi:hypothetical protein
MWSAWIANAIANPQTIVRDPDTGRSIRKSTLKSSHETLIESKRFVPRAKELQSSAPLRSLWFNWSS